MNANTQPDYIALAMVLALALVVVGMVIRKWLSGRKKTDGTAVTEVAPSAQTSVVAPGTAGKIKLNGVEPRTAAMLMAMVADEMGKPISELRFISIEEVDE